MDVIIILLAGYLLYRLVFDFIIPVKRTVSNMKQNAERMHRQQEEYRQRQQPEQKPQADFTQKDSATTDGEYIDFEEIKD